jgi:hypothetical protein
MSKIRRTSFYRDLILLAAGGLLAIVGALVNTYVTTKNEAKMWERRTQFELKQKLFNQRIKLIERTIKIFNKSALVEFYNQGAKSTKAKMTLGDKFIDLHTEFWAVMSLNCIYFGPEVKKSYKLILNKSGRWWKLDSNLKDEYLSNMQKELKLDFQYKHKNQASPEKAKAGES